MQDSGQKKNSWLSGEALLLALAFVLWMIMFRDYLSGKAAIFDDAVSYYDHIKFYLDNLRRGIFPLWDPFWFCGAPNNFFLQRMGAFNPFLLLTNVFHMAGLPYTTAYLLYLSFYYFVGCLGFYLLAKKILQDQLISFAAFVLLLFSALGTRSFDSYMILMFTPMAWFFYFLVSFSQQPRRSSFLGMVLTLATAFTTYIPFYFLLVTGSFLIFYTVIYFRTLPELWRRYLDFAVRNKLLVALCAALLLASLVPGYLFFKASSGGGEFVMPTRNTNQAAGSILAVQRQDIGQSWSVLEEIFFSRYYYIDLRLIQFAILYIPLLAYVVFFLGLLTRADKKIFFLFLWGSALLLLCMPIASPVYAFVYKFVFFFKYIRTLHFLLWGAILPIFCLFLAAQLKTLLSWRPDSKLQKVGWLLYIALIHGGLAWVMYSSKFPLITSYLLLALSFVFFSWWLLGSLRQGGTVTALIFLLLAAIEPFEVYTYLAQNSKPYYPYAYAYDHIDLKFHYTRFSHDVDADLGEDEEIIDRTPNKRVVQPPTDIYYASKWYGFLAGNIDYDILRKYRKHRFILYDQVERMDEEKVDFISFETSLAENRNTAFVSTDDPRALTPRSIRRHSFYAQPIEEDSDSFRVVAFNANHIKIETNFIEPKFLVYNDSYHSQWRALINGRQVPFWRTNIAFKGVWVPAGTQTVEFKFGSWPLWGMYYGLLIVINAVFVVMLVWWSRESRGKRHE